jgi:CDP-diacylglycerol---glycerol-3-phosphate 3-phosphatidyltransferase
VLPSPADEIAGVFHMKVFAVDDTVIISGSNLSSDYFCDRQDRYVSFGAVPDLASYYHGLVSTLGECSEQVAQITSGGSTQTKTRAPMVPRDDRGRRISEYVGQWKSLSPTNAEGMDTWVFPTIQCAPLGINQDLDLTKDLLRVLPPGASLNLATAYLNPPQWLLESLTQACDAGVKFNLMSAHPESHGFKGAQGLMGVVPRCYSYLLEEILPRFRYVSSRRSSSNSSNATGTSGDANLGGGLQLYRRHAWTFHAKGIWMKGEAGSSDYVSVVGSSNFGCRSYALDLEAQAVVVTTAPLLRGALEEEWQHLARHCEEETWEKAERSAVGNTPQGAAVKVLASVMGRFL